MGYIDVFINNKYIYVLYILLFILLNNIFVILDLFLYWELFGGGVWDY